MSQITRYGSGGTPLPEIETLTGDTGGPVGPDGAFNINILGGVGITTTGNPGTNTITIDADGTTTMNYTLVNTTPYVVVATDNFLGVDSSGGAITVQLPNAPATGRTYAIKDINGTAAANNITVTTVGGVVLIDAAATFVINTAYQSIQVLFNGTKYLVF